MSVSEFVMNAASSIYTALTPEPVSDHFKEGGMFYGYNEDATQIIVFMTLLFLIDNLLVKPFLTPKSRYFALHACANAVSCLGAWPDVVKAYTTDPINLFVGPSRNMIANSATISLHLYHMLAFKVTSADIFHHLVFVGGMSTPAIPLKHAAGVSINLSCFFLSGLPGGIDYILLVLMYEGIISKATEKAWFSNINAYLRGPSMVVYTYLGWVAVYHQKYEIPIPLAVVVIFLHFYNGQYYSKQAVESAAIFFFKEEQRKKTTSFSADALQSQQQQAVSGGGSTPSLVVADRHIKQD